VPALKFGEIVLTQSCPIIEYLEEVYPLPNLLPNSAEDRAYVRALAQIIACDIHPLNNLRILDYRASESPHNESNNLPWYHHWVELGFNAFEYLLASHSCDGRYCFADKPGIADAFLIPQVYNAIRYECDLQNYPLIRQIYQHCTGLDAFIKAAPESQPDAIVPA
jgi:maleylacetoacetate isomerase